MPRNIEIKARIENRNNLIARATRIADEGPIEINQDDTFFRCENGRLKLRIFSEHEGELIFYQRADEHGPEESFYLRSPTSTPVTLRDSLSMAYGQIGRVQKHRTLFLVGRTRIHVDVVEGLGEFVELEVVLKENESVDCGIDEAHSLMEQLDINPSQLVQGAYVDLITQLVQHTDLL